MLYCIWLNVLLNGASGGKNVWSSSKFCQSMEISHATKKVVTNWMSSAARNLQMFNTSLGGA